MKEITKAKFINTWASEWDERTGWKVSEVYHKQFSEQLEYLINQEVEKRIADRMPPAMYGWICPRCGAVHSPYSTACHCLPPVRTWTGTSTSETKGGNNG
jgi:hypothetical protein